MNAFLSSPGVRRAGFVVALAAVAVLVGRFVGDSASDLTAVAMVAALSTVFLATALVVGDVIVDRTSVPPESEAAEKESARDAGTADDDAVGRELQRVGDRADRRMDTALSLAILTALVGFMLIVGSVADLLMPWGGYNAAGNQYYWIAAASGVLTEFIAATFFFILTRMGAQVRAFRADLVSFRKFELAAGLARDLEGQDRVGAIRELVLGLPAPVKRAAEAEPDVSTAPEEREDVPDA